ncbi:uncharacterized protein LOC115229760 [Octopus sinensis]|uniref:Uncharacterized protein LOC115229760 n=1 Tax=Octopus sinensis TaxID=2607531 RepID=A0A6P7U107_9MOLL|nr:uncharacterized protein LOC115229760 [Octopus sinensis]
MPRGGWPLTVDYFNLKFGKKKSISELKRLIASFRNNASVRDNARNDASSNDKGGTNLTLYTKCYEELLIQIEENSSIPFEERMPTPKVPAQYINHLVIDLINRALIQYTSDNPPKSINDISTLIYSSQCTYHRITKKEFSPSNWVDNVKRKIESLTENESIITKFFTSTVSDEEKKKATDILCSFNYKKLKSGEFERISTAINDKIKILMKKVNISDSRRQFRKDNRNFELYRKSFYRRLNSTIQHNECIDTDRCLKFWTNVWKKRDISEYQLGVNRRVTGAEYHEPDVNDTFILNIIEFLPNWKAPGCDGVYNFFIKKLDSLHKFLFDEIRNIITGSSQPQSWFYTGITYLIPKKDNSTEAGDFRPITCMPCLYKLVTKCVDEKIAEYVEVYDLISECQLGTKRHCQGAKEQALINCCVNRSHEYNYFLHG